MGTVKPHEFQAFGHLTRTPIALSHSIAERSVENLNQIPHLRHHPNQREAGVVSVAAPGQ